MKKLSLVLFALLTLPLTVNAQEQFVPQNTGTLEAELTFSGVIRSTAPLSELNLSIYALPVGATAYEANAQFAAVDDAQGNKKLLLKWGDVSSVTYRIDARVQNSARIRGAKRVQFPYNPPREVLQYLAPTEKSPITPEIRMKALELTQGSENGFEAVARLSTWIYDNLKYDSSYYGKFTPADVVFRERAGVCAEFTSLMVSMARAVGIPARSVAGVIYSRDGWGYHAWAEVYLDGWVPVDPTWNEIGWLDAAHVELAKFEDVGDVEIGVGYTYTAFQRPSVTFDQPSVTVDVVRTEPMQHIFDTSATTFPNRIGVGDSAVVEVTTRNNADGCIATSTDVVSRVDGRGREVVSVTAPISIAMCQGDSSKSHFILKSRDDLESGFVYYNLADIKTFLGEDITVDLTVDSTDERRSSLDLVVERTTTKKGDRIRFDVRTDTSFRVYSDLPIIGDRIVADKTGVHYIIAATDTGEVEREEIVVREDLPFLISTVGNPQNVTCGQAFNFTFAIENLRTSAQEFDVQTTVSDELESINAQKITVDKTEKKTVTLATRVRESCTGRDQFIDVVVDGQRIHEPIKVEKPPTLGESAASLVGSAWNAILSFFRGVINFFGSLFG